MQFIDDHQKSHQIHYEWSTNQDWLGIYQQCLTRSYTVKIHWRVHHWYEIQSKTKRGSKRDDSQHVMQNWVGSQRSAEMEQPPRKHKGACHVPFYFIFLHDNMDEVKISSYKDNGCVNSDLKTSELRNPLLFLRKE